MTSRSMGKSCRLLGALRMTLRVCTRSYTLRLEWYTLRQWMNCSLSKSLSRRFSALWSFLTLAESVRALEATELAEELSDMRSKSVLLILVVRPVRGATLARVSEHARRVCGTGAARSSTSQLLEETCSGHNHTWIIIQLSSQVAGSGSEQTAATLITQNQFNNLARITT